MISLGYGAVCGAAHKNKKLSEVSNYKEGMPDWFRNEMEGALLTPTAMNQQKFFLELQPSGVVKAASGRGFYTKLDLGIVKYHFEVASGRADGIQWLD